MIEFYDHSGLEYHVDLHDLKLQDFSTIKIGSLFWNICEHQYIEVFKNIPLEYQKDVPSHRLELMLSLDPTILDEMSNGALCKTIDRVIANNSWWLLFRELVS